MKTIYLLLLLSFSTILNSQSFDAKTEFKNIIFQANKAVAIQLYIEKNKSSDKLDYAKSSVELKKELPGLNQEVVDNIDAIGQEILKNLSANESAEKLLPKIEQLIVGIKKMEVLNKADPKRVNTLTVISNRLQRIQNDYLTKVNSVGKPPASGSSSLSKADSISTYIDSLRHKLPLFSAEKVMEIIEWWDYLLWGSIGLFLVIIIMLFIFFKSIPDEPLRGSSHQLRESNNYDNGRQNFSLNTIRHDDLTKRLEELKRQMEDYVDARIKYSGQANEQPQTTENVEEKIIEEKYIESPEKGGFFLKKRLRGTITNNTLYVVRINRKKNTVEFDLVDNSNIGYRSAMDSSTTVLKPACNYSDEPTREHSKIIKADKVPGLLIDEGNGQYRIEQKINIKFQ